MAMAAERLLRPAGARTLVVLLAGALVLPVSAPENASAGGQRSRPRVEDVAVEAVSLLGDEAPAAVVGELAEGVPLKRVVRSIEAGTLAPRDASNSLVSTTASTAPPTSPPASAAADGNPVVAIDERGIDPPRLVVDPSSPLIVANTGTKTHVVEIRGSDLQKYSLEPDLVGVYELEALDPGRYTLRCIVAGHAERAVLTIPDSVPAGYRGPVGGKSARLAASHRVAAGIERLLDPDDYVGRMVMFDAIVAEMEEGGARAIEEAEQMRKTAARAQTKLESTTENASVAKDTTADPARVVERAEKHDVDPEMALLTNAILLAAKNGYDAGQITGFLLDDALDPGVWDTGQGLIRVRDAFVLGGVIPGVKPNNPPDDGVFQEDQPVAKREPRSNDESDRNDQGTEGAVAGTYRGEFTGRWLETYLAVSHPGAPRPIRNRVDVTITDRGVMRFTLQLVVHAAWVSNDENVSCDSRQSIFAAVTPTPTAELEDDGTFESSPFTTSVRRTDFVGPRCAEFPYDGESDEDLSGFTLIGSVDGDTVRGHIPFEAEGESFELEFRAGRAS